MMNHLRHEFSSKPELSRRDARQGFLENRQGNPGGKDPRYPFGNQIPEPVWKKVLVEAVADEKDFALGGKEELPRESLKGVQVEEDYIRVFFADSVEILAGAEYPGDRYFPVASDQLLDAFPQKLMVTTDGQLYRHTHSPFMYAKSKIEIWCLAFADSAFGPFTPPLDHPDGKPPDQLDSGGSPFRYGEKRRNAGNGKRCRRFSSEGGALMQWENQEN